MSGVSAERWTRSRAEPGGFGWIHSGLRPGSTSIPTYTGQAKSTKCQAPKVQGAQKEGNGRNVKGKLTSSHPCPTTQPPPRPPSQPQLLTQTRRRPARPKTTAPSPHISSLSSPRLRAAPPAGFDQTDFENCHHCKACFGLDHDRQGQWLRLGNHTVERGLRLLMLLCMAVLERRQQPRGYRDVSPMIVVMIV